MGHSCVTQVIAKAIVVHWLEWGWIWDVISVSDAIFSENFLILDHHILSTWPAFHDSRGDRMKKYKML